MHEMPFAYVHVAKYMFIDKWIINIQWKKLLKMIILNTIILSTIKTTDVS